jgi:hypothetical protein
VQEVGLSPFWILCAVIALYVLLGTFAVSSWDAPIQSRKGTGTDTTHWRGGTQGMTRSTLAAAEG